MRERALGQEVLKSLTPGQALIKIVNDELVRVMGERNESLDLNAPAPVVVMLAGLQGSGKTTTTAKLARLLGQEQGKKVMVVSCDVYRPAAIAQLETLAGQVGATFHASAAGAVAGGHRRAGAGRGAPAVYGRAAGGYRRAAGRR